MTERCYFCNTKGDKEQIMTCSIEKEKKHCGACCNQMIEEEKEKQWSGTQ